MIWGYPHFRKPPFDEDSDIPSFAVPFVRINQCVGHCTSSCTIWKQSYHPLPLDATTTYDPRCLRWILGSSKWLSIPHTLNKQWLSITTSNGALRSPLIWTQSDFPGFSARFPVSLGMPRSTQETVLAMLKARCDANPPSRGVSRCDIAACWPVMGAAMVKGTLWIPMVIWCNLLHSYGIDGPFHSIICPFNMLIFP